MKMRKILLWGLPILLAGWVIAVLITISSHEYQLSLIEWTTYELPERGGGSSGKQGDIEIDTNGGVWVVGGCSGVIGIHVFDGSRWSNQDKQYCDLAVGSHGQVWALNNNSNYVDYYDGNKWTYITSSVLRIPKDKYGKAKGLVQIEVDTQGRIWIATIDYGVDEIYEIKLHKVNEEIKFHIESSVVFETFKLMHADERGNVWVLDHDNGIWKFDGEEWKQIPDRGMKLEDVFGIGVDKQGNLWAGSECGGVMMYNGDTWISIVEEGFNRDYCGPRDWIFGITFDNQGRVWTWSYDKVQFLDNGVWTILTPDNSGILGENIIDVAIDNLDCVWILSAHSETGISMAKIQDIQLMSKKNVNLHKKIVLLFEYLSRGMNLFIVSIIILLWIATFFNVLPGVWRINMDGKELWISYAIYAILGGVAGVITNVGFVFIGILAMSEGAFASELFQLGSKIGGVVGLFGGLVGGRIGKRYNRGYLGALIGGALISLLGYCLFMYLGIGA